MSEGCLQRAVRGQELLGSLKPQIQVCLKLTEPLPLRKSEVVEASRCNCSLAVIFKLFLNSWNSLLQSSVYINASSEKKQLSEGVGSWRGLPPLHPAPHLKAIVGEACRSGPAEGWSVSRHCAHLRRPLLLGNFTSLNTRGPVPPKSHCPGLSRALAALFSPELTSCSAGLGPDGASWALHLVVCPTASPLVELFSLE